MSNARSPRSVASTTVGTSTWFRSRMSIASSADRMQPGGCESGYGGSGRSATTRLHDGSVPVERDQGRVTREILLKAPRDEVWEAITRPERLAAWFGGEIDID